MGAVNSCFIPHHHGESQHGGSSRSSRFKSHHRSLSATFNLTTVGDDIDYLTFININNATEEELMTLPGINRIIAKNIIDYRQHIGGFRRVEDLALVSGVGADKLSRIRCDISISSRPLANSRQCSVRENGPDGESVRETKAGHGGNVKPLRINVNTANIFQLIKIKGLSMADAESIVTYRERNGLFTSLDNLIKVKGLGAGIVSLIRPYLTLDESADNPAPIQRTSSGIDSASLQNGDNASLGGDITSHTNTVALSCSQTLPCNNYQCRSMASIENLLQIIGPLAEVPKRPKISQFFDFQHKNRQILRLSSWNLEQCSLEKLSNPGVRDVICMTVLENGFGLVIVQELLHDKALLEICQELNEPSLPNGRSWKGHRGKWKCVISQVTSKNDSKVEYSGFLYDSLQKIDLLDVKVLDILSDTSPFTRMSCIGLFKVNGHLDLAVVSVQFHQQSQNSLESNLMCDVLDSLTANLPAGSKIVLAEDMNLAQYPEVLAFLDLKGYTSCFASDISTSTNNDNNNTTQIKCSDNIWINHSAVEIWTGNSDIVREGLSSPWIPNGWQWGGTVSSHCPVYMDLYTSNDSTKRELPIRTDGIRFILGADY